MLEVLEDIDNVSEVSRVFFILVRRQAARMEHGALVEACKRTAGLVSRYPRPIPAIKLAIDSGLLRQRLNTVEITERGRHFVSASDATPLGLSEEQGLLLLSALVDDGQVVSALHSFLRNFQPI